MHRDIKKELLDFADEQEEKRERERERERKRSRQDTESYSRAFMGKGHSLGGAPPPKTPTERRSTAANVAVERNLRALPDKTVLMQRKVGDGVQRESGGKAYTLEDMKRLDGKLYLFRYMVKSICMCEVQVQFQGLNRTRLVMCSKKSVEMRGFINNETLVDIMRTTEVELCLVNGTWHLVDNWFI